jgi:inhibitor of KinA sporulation pathway (predicted exonuclease)
VLLDAINSQELFSLSQQYLLIVDLEATCCDSGTIPNTESEIIEIGAIMVHRSKKIEIDAFCEFIKPVRHPTLTPFCTQLTTITQEVLDSSLPFKEVMDALEHWLRPYQSNYVMCSWGNYDRNHIISDCQYFGVINPIESSHLNLKAAFAKKQGIKRCGLQRALEFAGLTFEGQHHRGIDDARNIARLLDYSI